VLEIKAPSEKHFALLRLALGVYLLVHFGSLVPYAGELFSTRGMLPDASLLPSARVFPNLLGRAEPAAAKGFVVSLAVVSGLFAAGIYRRPCAVVLWFGFATLFNRNPFISNPSIPYVGWLLLACSVVPNERIYRAQLPKADDFRVPQILVVGGWLLLGLGYSLSGVHKLGSPSWLDGTALRHVLALPLARDTALHTFLLTLPDFAYQGLTWGSLFAELSALPLFLFSRTRPYAWCGLVAMQLGILTLLDFADLTLGMVLFHLFLFDPGWLRSLGSRRPLESRGLPDLRSNA
jgi:hypothetical protein